MSSSATFTTDSFKKVAANLSPMRDTADKSMNGSPNNADGEMFSPTSAAALALSTLHQHGADRNKRPEDLKGTRLFIQGERKEEREQEENEPATQKETQAPAASPTFFVGGPSSNAAPPVPAHYPPPPPGYQYAPDPRYSHPPAASPWQPAQYNQYPMMHLSTPAAVGPSPPSSRIGTEIGAYHHTNFFLLQNARASPTMGYMGPSPTPNGLRSLDPNDKPYARAQSQTSLVTPTPKKAKAEKKSGSQTPGYSRKKKSLGVLAENFLNQYRGAPRGYTVIVDEAAVKLGVERRRIYDVVNILEAIQLVCKKQKNTYTWMGMEHLDVVFGRLQADAIDEYPQDAKDLLGVSTVSSDRTDDQKEVPKGREFKSLARLSQEFLQVFLVGHTTLSLPDASDKIQGATSMEELVKLGQGRVSQMDEKEIKAAAARGLKTKIRRLYDIANVFLSVGLLEKVDSADSSRRPNFSWCYRSSPKDIYDLHHSVKKATVTPSTSTASSPTQDEEAQQKFEAWPSDSGVQQV